MPSTRLVRRASLRFRHRLLALRVQVTWRRVARLAAKYSPDQPRVPAGSQGGGQWTSGGTGSFRLAQNNPRTPMTMRRVAGEAVAVSAADAVRLDVATALARQAMERVREIDPKWQPAPGLYSGVQGAIRNAEAIRREADAQWQRLGGVPETAESYSTIFMPNGRLIGQQYRGASTEVRTVTAAEMDVLLGKALRDTKEIEPLRLPFPGAWYQRLGSPDTISIRLSDKFGLTLDVLSPRLDRDGQLKVHQR